MCTGVAFCRSSRCALNAQPEFESLLRLQQACVSQSQQEPCEIHRAVLMMVIITAASADTSELLHNVPSPTPRSCFLAPCRFHGVSGMLISCKTNSWEAVSCLQLLGLSFLSSFSECLPCDWAVRTYGFAPQVHASLQDVSVHRMDPDSRGKHVWKTLPYSFLRVPGFLLWVIFSFFHLNKSVQQ